MEREKHLYRLEELSDYQVASDDPDIRNWDVRDVDNRLVGKVDSLLVNIPTKRVVYVDVEVDDAVIAPEHDPYAGQGEIREFVNREGETHLIIPIGMVTVDKENNVVRAVNLNHTTFAGVPRYNRNLPVTREYERDVLTNYTSELTELDDDSFYERPEFRKDYPGKNR